MGSRYPLHPNAHSVECPYCGAAPGSPCVRLTNGWTARLVHMARIDASMGRQPSPESMRPRVRSHPPVTTSEDDVPADVGRVVVVVDAGQET